MTRIVPQADAFVRGGTYQNQNYGSEPHLTVKDAQANYDRQSFLRFDGSTIAPDARVSLILTVASLGDEAVADRTVELRALYDDAWQENKVTWATKPTLGPRLATLTIRQESVNQSLSVDVTGYVRAERLRGETVSFALVQPTDQNAAVSFNSREGNTPPRLVSEVGATGDQRFALQPSAGNPLISAPEAIGQEEFLSFDVVRGKDYFPAPRATYYAFTGTDHSTGAGGIFAVTGADKFDISQAEGQVFNLGRQAETPCLYQDADGETLMMFHSLSSGGTQASRIASLANDDGTAWREEGVALPNLTSTPEGGGPTTHTGYAEVFTTNINGQYRCHAWSLLEGRGAKRFGYWQSTDGRNFTLVSEVSQHAFDLGALTGPGEPAQYRTGPPPTDNTTPYVPFTYDFHPFWWQGALYAFGLSKTSTSGAEAVSNSRVVFLKSVRNPADVHDLRYWKIVSFDVFAPTHPWEQTTAPQNYHATAALVEGDELTVYLMAEQQRVGAYSAVDSTSGPEDLIGSITTTGSPGQRYDPTTEATPSLIIYPNPPPGGKVQLQLAGGNQLWQIHIIDPRGQVIYRGIHAPRRVTLDVDLPKGLYLVKGSAGRNTFSEKVLVE